MIILNYGHPLTADQFDQITALLGVQPEVRDLLPHIDREQPLAEVARVLADSAGLGRNAWQSLPLVCNPPGLAPLALALAAEMHGRRGSFVPILNIRPVASAALTHYEVAEVIDLQKLRLEARAGRIPDAT